MLTKNRLTMYSTLDLILSVGKLLIPAHIFNSNRFDSIQFIPYLPYLSSVTPGGNLLWYWLISKGPASLSLGLLGSSGESVLISLGLLGSAGRSIFKKSREKIQQNYLSTLKVSKMGDMCRVNWKKYIMGFSLNFR